jgi:hypothetical protein
MRGDEAPATLSLWEPIGPFMVDTQFLRLPGHLPQALDYICFFTYLVFLMYIILIKR